MKLENYKNGEFVHETEIVQLLIQESIKLDVKGNFLRLKRLDTTMTRFLEIAPF